MVRWWRWTQRPAVASDREGQTVTAVLWPGRVDRLTVTTQHYWSLHGSHRRIDISDLAVSASANGM